MSCTYHPGCHVWIFTAPAGSLFCTRRDILHPELLNLSGSVGEINFCKSLTNIRVSGIFLTYVKHAFVSDTINMLLIEIRGAKSENDQCKLYSVGFQSMPLLVIRLTVAEGR